MAAADTDILIIGAGFAGASTAYHLKRHASRSVVVIEREAVAGVHSSGRNAAIVREYADHAELQGMLSAGAEALRSGRLARFEDHGVMLLGLGDQDVAPHFPRARGGGRWCPLDGVVDVAGLLQAYLADQDVRYDTQVLGWDSSSHGVRVRTTRGDIACRIVVNAAGPWAGVLGRLPVLPRNRHLFVTSPLDWVEADWPTVWDGHHGLYFRPESGGLLLCPCDETPAEPGVYVEDPDTLEDLAEKLERLQPDLGELSVARAWVGQRTFAPDHGFVIGFDPRDERVFHVAGLGGHGVTASWVIGQLAADLITARSAQPVDLSPQRLHLEPLPCL